MSTPPPPTSPTTRQVHFHPTTATPATTSPSSTKPKPLSPLHTHPHSVQDTVTSQLLLHTLLKSHHTTHLTSSLLHSRLDTLHQQHTQDRHRWYRLISILDHRAQCRRQRVESVVRRARETVMQLVGERNGINKPI